MTALIRVAVPVPLPRLFDYALADAAVPPAPGCRVLVPFGKRELVGVVVGPGDGGGMDLSAIKPVLRVLDDTPWLTDELLATLHWAARYYQHTVGEVFDAAWPSLLRTARELPDTGEPGLALTPEGQAGLGAPRRRGTQVDGLLERLAAGPVATSLLDDDLPGWRSAARTLRSRGWLVACTLPRAEVRAATRPGPPLHDEQAVAVAAIEAAADTFAPFLLEGVTGSGKTEVYLGAIAATIARGRQALVLVPEIALTPQTMQRFRERLGIDVAILHSGLGDAERAKAWATAARGEAKVVLGTRSAVFTPLPAAGLVIVDEEHDASYKQQDGFRYHARDLAIVRARSLGVPAVLGSATPSLESLANVEAGRYTRLRLSQRAGGAQPPSLKVLDVRRKRMEHGLAVETLQAIRACVDDGGQVLVFRNRRGYAPVLFCQGCGWTAACTRCDRPMTVHRGAARLRCHHCGAEERMPAACPACASPALAPQGQGTERLEETLSERFPDVPVVRIDRDSTRSRSGRDALFGTLHAPGARILVGTQMLAKGHDLAELALVVVVGVDEGLYSVDFRAPERLGQLIVQVAGRAGRARRAGAVLLQTHHPQHPLLGALIEGGYAKLAAGLLEERRAAALPPFAQVALLRAEATSLAEARAFLEAAVAAAAPYAEEAQAHGPMPAPMPRRAGYQRMQVLVEAPNRSAMQRVLPAWLDAVRALPGARRVRWSIDVDPVEMG